MVYFTVFHHAVTQLITFSTDLQRQKLLWNSLVSHLVWFSMAIPHSPCRWLWHHTGVPIHPHGCPPSWRCPPPPNPIPPAGPTVPPRRGSACQWQGKAHLEPPAPPLTPPSIHTHTHIKRALLKHSIKLTTILQHIITENKDCSLKWCLYHSWPYYLACRKTSHQKTTLNLKTRLLCVQRLYLYRFL